MKGKKFDHCGRQYEKHPNGEITISMKGYIQNLEKVCVARERLSQLDDSSWERKVMSSEGSMVLAMGNKGVALPFSVRCESTPTEARAGPRARCDQSK